MLKFACLRHGEQTGQGDFTLGAAVTVRDFANEHKQAQGSLGDIVGGIHTLLFEERKGQAFTVSRAEPFLAATSIEPTDELGLTWIRPPLREHSVRRSCGRAPALC